MERTVRLSSILSLATAAFLTSSSHTIGATAEKQRLVFAPVLIYHHVKPSKASDDAIERGLTVLPAQFEAQLRYLHVAGYHVVTLLQLVRFLRSGSVLPAKPVALTFDDGYADVFHGVYEPLLRAHLRATFFIVPGFLGSARYLTWRQVLTMAAHGMDIEAHTMTHPDLTRIGPRSLHWQLTESRRELQTKLHRAVRLLAYPYGAYNPAVLAAAKRAGYVAAFTTQEGWMESSTNSLREPRVYVDFDDSIAIFTGRVRDDASVLAQDPT